jgi:hypothetical protein
LDDDIVSQALAQLLRQAGHDVQLPADVGLAGKADPVHLAHAIRQDRVCLTRNYRDFENLHDLILTASGPHPGIFVVRRDNDPKRNPKPHDIVRAISNLLAAGMPLAANYHTLNQWQ